MDANETPEAALVRELHEELGVTVAPADLVPLTFSSHALAKFHLLMPLYGAGLAQCTAFVLHRAVQRCTALSVLYCRLLECISPHCSALNWTVWHSPELLKIVVLFTVGLGINLDAFDYQKQMFIAKILCIMQI